MFFEACLTTTGICRSQRLRNSRSTTLRSSELSSSTFSITRISRTHSEDRAVTIRLRILQQQPVQVSAFGPKHRTSPVRTRSSGPAGTAHSIGTQDHLLIGSADGG